ncbi:alkaline phosphatase, partial [Staphylococcus arlettae]
VKNKNDLKNSKGDQVLGLFAKNDMPLNIDAPNKNPELVDMEKSALDRLSKNDKGFFLMVEGASIDKAGHPNDVTGVMSEMGGFEKAFKHATEYAKSNPDTLVVATADHSTGGMSIAKGEDYEWNPDAIHSMKHSGKYMTEQIADGKNPEKVINEGYGFDISKDNMSDIKEEAENMKGLKEDDSEYEDQLQKLQDAIQKPINDKSNTFLFYQSYAPATPP